jgi:hypothetical protein
MALSEAALTTLDVCLDEVELEPSVDRKVRARLERYIEAASSLVAVIIGNGAPIQLHHGEVTVAVAGMDTPTLILPHAPIVAVAEVTIDDDVVPADEYEVEDASLGFLGRVGGVWPFQGLVTDGVVAAKLWRTARRNVSVTYTAGWVTPAQATVDLPRTLPHAIEDAVVELVTSRWRRRNKDLRVVGETFEQSSYTYGGVAVPAEVMAALAPYVRVPNA